MSVSDAELAVLARRVAEAMRTGSEMLVTAESCTGGWVGKVCTDLPGSSAWFRGGAIVYDNDLKVRMTGVTPATLDKHGAVSEATVSEMARGALASLDGTVSVAISGVAGPDGGTPDKPVGTVCLGLDSARGQISRRYQFRGTRDWIKLLTSQVALDWIRRYALDLQIAESALFRR